MKNKIHAQQPNIVLIVADDLGWSDIGCYGSSLYETPNIDGLATDGVRFTQGYAACPVCSPSRAAIQTGKYPTEVNLTDWLPGRRVDTERNRFITVDDADELASEEVTIAELLQKNGYTTFFAGKWHLGEEEAYWPEHQGYDINVGGWKRGAPNHSRDGDCDGYFAPFCNPRLPDGPDGEYLPERLSAEVNTFIDAHQETPFFICLPFYLVHTPLQAKQELIDKYKRKVQDLGLVETPAFLLEQPWMQQNAKPAGQYRERILQSHAVYGAMVEALDQNVGRILDKLRATGLYDNTLIIFTSDNGGLSTAEGSPTANRPLRGGKGWLYEGGIRVPFIMKYPGNEQASTESAMPVSGMDILPTSLGVSQIKEPLKQISGVDISHFLKHKKAPKRQLYWHYPHYSNQGGNPGSVVLDGDYKLIDDFETGVLELYNLATDPGEQNNLAAQQPKRVKQLYRKLERWRKKTDAKMMQPNPEWNGEG